MKTLVAFLCCVAAAAAFPATKEEQNLEWSAWKKFHGKTYSSETEETFRSGIWLNNMKIIEKHNADKRHTYTLGMNQFGDLTLNEYKLLFLGLRGHYSNDTESVGSTYLEPSNVKLPATVDWRTKGYVTPVKNQGQCGSCWAFSTTGSLEGQHFKKTGKLVSLSEQNLVDCSGKYGNHGCEGGLMDNAFRYIRDNHGIDTEASYPYRARDESCKFKRADVGATDTGYVDIAHRSENALQSAVATVGPISVAIDAGHSSFQLYHSGVYNEPRCSQTQLDHGVLAVGYGTHNGQDYWLVKNSWAKSWGMQGYILMSRNRNNQCGIATQASYPLV